MRILRNNSTSFLYEKVKSLGKNQKSLDSWRCIHLALSSQGGQSTFVSNTVSSLLADDDGYIYICHDGDIFILFKGALRPILRKLSQHFTDFKPSIFDEQNANDNNDVTIFDLGKSWWDFFDICRSRAVTPVPATNSNHMSQTLTNTHL